VHLQVQQTSLGTEHGGSFRFGNKSQTVVVLVAQETSLNRSSSCRSLASIVPDSGHGKEVPDIALFSVKDLAQALLELVAHSLSQLEEVVGSNIDFGLSRRKRWEVDRVDVGVSGKHQLELEPLHLLNTWLGVASRCQRVGDVGTPSNNLLVLVVVEDCGNLRTNY
jgi:hypothetical protein